MTKKKQPKKTPKLSISFATNSRKKESVMFRKGGTYISRAQYLKDSGLTESQLKWSIASIVEPATNDKGQLLKKDKKAIAQLFNKFVDNKKNIPDRYEIKINITSARSIEALKGKDIFMFYRGKEFKFSYNDFIYFCAVLLDRISNAVNERVIYTNVMANVNEVDNTAIIKL